MLEEFGQVRKMFAEGTEASARGVYVILCDVL